MAESSWPGDRVPSPTDVEQANEGIDLALLRDFRDNLLRSEDARNCEKLVFGRPAFHTVCCPHNMSYAMASILKKVVRTTMACSRIQ